MRYYRKHPERWAIDALGITAWRDYPEACADQIRLLRSIFENKRTACKSGHKTGKTFVSAAATLTWLSLYPKSKVITTAPTGRQIEKLLWREIRLQHANAERLGMPIGGRLLTKELIFSDDHYAIGFATDKESGGVQAQGWSGDQLLFVLDEAAGISAEVWNVANTALQSETAHIVAAGNPVDPATPFYDKCVDPLWHTLTLSSWDSPNVTAGQQIVPGCATQSWCDEMLATEGTNSPEYLFRVLGEFPSGSAFSLISLAQCEAAHDRTVAGGVKAGGCDVARFGDDKTVLTAMDGGQIVEQEEFAGLDVVAVAGVTAEWYKRYGWQCVAVDDTGVGGGVTDVLGSAGINVLPVNFGESASDPEKHANKAMEMLDMLAHEFIDGTIGGLPRNAIVRELTGRQYSFTPKQQKKLEPKDKFKARIGKSPDRGDSLMLANYARRIGGNGAASIAQVYV